MNGKRAKALRRQADEQLAKLSGITVEEAEAVTDAVQKAYTPAELGAHAAAYAEWQRRVKVRLLRAIEEAKAEPRFINDVAGPED